VPWGVRLRLEYLVNVLDAAFFVIYIRNFFAELRQKLVFKLLVFLSVLFSVATLIVPQGVVRYLREPFQLGLAVMAPIAIVYLARLAFRNVYGARVLTLGVMGITAAFFNDALSSAEVISTPTVFSLAILAFTFLQAILISGKSVTLFYENAELSQKLLRSDKLRDEFLTQTSHELRTPVQAMVQTLENVRRGVSGAVSEQVQRTLAVIEENGRRLMYVIDDLTDFVRLKHSDIRLNVQTVSLKKIVHPILKLCLGLSENKQFALIDEIPEGLHDIQTDPSRLQQILLNLVSTAIRYSHSPAITVKLGTLHGQLAISVLYFGNDPDARFADVIDLPNEDVGPLVTQKLAQLLGGQYHYQKLAESHHALTITLPYQQISTLEVLLSSSHARTEYRKSDGDGLVSMPERLGDSPANSGGQVLLIGDNASQNRLLQDQLASLGKDSVIAKNGAEAMLQLQDREDIALVISDVLLSDVSGIELAMNIRASFDIGILPIILLIDNNQAGVAASAFSAGVNDLIRRPFEKAEVIARVKNVLLQREASLARENYRALNRELEIARSIQDSILPKANPGNENYKIEAVCLPARSIGGDFYDFLEEDGFIGVLIADVAGHGIPAALYAAMLKIALHNLRDQARFPEKLLKNLNDVMVERGERTFISCAYTMVDFKNRRLLHANAGHLPLLLQEPGKRAVKRVHPPGGVLGVRKAAAITVEMQHFLPKTRLLLFTDGVIELANKNGDFFEESRLISLLEDMREQPIVEVRDRLLAEMRGFSEGGTFLDDVTFIIIDL
jgi:two-component system sensor histidine kinase ChiS